ncbi:MAG: Na+/H+ antiporter subunit E [Alphaproteobacteria bacterium]
MSLLWLALNGADVKSWIVGLPTAILAAAINFPSLPRGSWRWKFHGVLPMLWFFIKESYRGAFDVARRALDPRLPIDPGLITYNCRLATTSARLFFADLITLMPGTLSACSNDRELVIHALDVRGDVESGLRELEEKVAALFGEHLTARCEVKP